MIPKPKSWIVSFNLIALYTFQLLCVVSTILQRNPELAFNGSLDVDSMVENAYEMFRKDFHDEGNGGENIQNELYPFFNAPTATITRYFDLTIVNNILQGHIRFSK